VWGAGVALFDPGLENVLLLESRHNKVHEFPGGGLGFAGRAIERFRRSFEDERGVYSVASMFRTAEAELEQETGITRSQLTEKPTFIDTYYGRKPRDTFTVFGAIALSHISIEALTLQKSEVNTQNGPGAVWVPRSDVGEIGPVHFAITQRAVDDAYSVLYDRLVSAA